VEPRDSRTLNVFVVSTGFHYYFSTLLVDYLDLQNVAYVMFEPREGIECRAAVRYRVVWAGADDRVARVAGKKAGKWWLARRAFAELELAGKDVVLFSPSYNDTLVYALRSRIERHCSSFEYNLTPDGAAMLRPIPGKGKGERLPAWLTQLLYDVEPADTRHKHGTYSPFISHVYHFAAKKIYTNTEKIVIVPMRKSARPASDEILVLGGLYGISREFVLAAKERAAHHPVKYRMHPKNRSGEGFIEAEAPEWEELKLEAGLEEHLLDHPYRAVMGYYSSAVVFNHLFVSNSRSEFIIERGRDDPDYHVTADACGIPVTIV
jgi:hypothetical protein